MMMHSKILEDRLFEDIQDIVGKDNAKIIVPLLDQDEDDSK